jgi:hypothetical protein
MSDNTRPTPAEDRISPEALERLEKELAPDAELPEIALTPEEERAVRAAIRRQLTIDYRQFLLSAQLNNLVGAKELAEQQNEEAKRVVLRIHYLDQGRV